MPIAKDKYSGNAKGGTELMKFRLEEAISPELLDNFQIFVSRVHEDLSENHVRILWLQDLAGDPESDHLKNGGWNKFHRLVFSSHWQMRGYIERYNIPWSKCAVIRNGIVPIDFTEKKRDGKIKLIYTPTPHRGLNILYPVFDKLTQEMDDIELNVFSSFKLYGWDDRDKPFQDLFKSLENHPKINYHGTVPNDELRKHLAESHIFAYPSTWQETSCLCLMEAMSAGLFCVHSNFGALPETAANWTYMYQMQDDLNAHASMFYTVLKSAIEDIKTMDDQNYSAKIRTQKAYTDVFYNWELLKMQWESLLMSLKSAPRELPKTSGQLFEYRS
jgi:UDP-glucose:(glucosyl)LPS alpha-1,2-glucosyltransferase